MKKIVLTLLFVFAAVVYAKASEPSAVCDTTEIIPIIGGDGPGMGGGPRSIPLSEIRVCAVSFGDIVYVVVTVLQDLGQMEFSITNNSSGWYVDGEFNAVPGTYPIPISGSSGYYIVSLYLQDGREYEGMFHL